MAVIDAPPTAGTPCWVDLMAKNQQATMNFYQDLLGWQGEVGPAEFGGYAVMTLNGRPVAGIGPAMAPEGMPAPPHVWTTYLSSDDADATTRRISAAHGTVMVPPMDVGTLGRMAVATDPTGAVFGVWEHKDFFGATVVNEPGALTWNECNTRDAEAASTFYGAAFDLTSSPSDVAPGYYILSAGGKPVAGLQDITSTFPDEVPAHWKTWFAVDDVDSTRDAHIKAGGSVIVPPTDMPIGRMASLQDPWGAVFCVITPTAP